MKLSILLRGFLMGCADIVPGVSGGTVALVTGIYDHLVNSIRKITQAFILACQGKFKQAWTFIDLPFLIPLFVGLALAIALMAKIITAAMTTYPELTLGLFFGLMMGSITIVGKMVHERSFYHFSLLLLSAIFALILTSSTPMETAGTPFNFFLAGLIAIVAMILPGISGSFLLLIMGKYMQIMEAIKSCLSIFKDAAKSLMGSGPPLSELWLQSQELLLGIIIPFGLGCVLGLASFSWVLTYFLTYHRNVILTILVGLMLGSLHKLWPMRIVLVYIHREDKPDKILQDQTIAPFFDDPMHLASLALILLGFALVMLIEKKAKVSKTVL